MSLRKGVFNVFFCCTDCSAGTVIDPWLREIAGDDGGNSLGGVLVNAAVVADLRCGCVNPVLPISADMTAVRKYHLRCLTHIAPVCLYCCSGGGSSACKIRQPSLVFAFEVPIGGTLSLLS